MKRHMTLLLCVAFVLSGAAALLFEALWFRQVGLALGNSVWAATTVLASFMGGLALGNALAARYAARSTQPLRLYAAIEIVAGLAGAGLVTTLPSAAPRIALALGALGPSDWLLDGARLLAAVAMLIVPTTAIGATLPVLAHALSQWDPAFGRVLGRLYGWNTLGGMAGALLGEAWLIGHLGLWGTGLLAATLNLAAALLCLGFAGQRPAVAPAHPAPEPLVPGASLGVRRVLAAAFLAGGALLALEVVWFRFLQLFALGTHLVFAVLLSVILAGVGLGGLAASVWLGRDDGAAPRWLPVLALLGGVATVATYAALSPGTTDYGGGLPFAILGPALRLMLLPSMLSGMLYTFQGRVLRDGLGGTAVTAGALTLANTLGAACGSLLAGLVLLPGLGMERSLFVLALVYVPIAWLCGLATAPPGHGTAYRLVRWSTAGATLVVLALFPFGLLRGRFLKHSLARFVGPDRTVIAQREGLTETVTCVERTWRGRPVSRLLVTNGHAMSGSSLASRRYMQLYVYWALAVQPRIQTALLISYGLGNTARALADARQMTTIDIVDTSRELVELSAVVFPDPADNPTRDPRATVHIEDGRFFLQKSRRRYDLITSEPPPPRLAGVASLYSTEYFQLIHERLTDGGIVTYWLPVHQLSLVEAKSIVGGFCLAFPDCTLWTGAGFDWMLGGTRGLSSPATEEAFGRQWRDPRVGPKIAAVGLEKPEQLGALFIAGAEHLVPWSRDARPLDDDHPHRIAPLPADESDWPRFETMMDARLARARFESSDLVRRVWPAGLRARTGAFFEAQATLNEHFVKTELESPIRSLHGLLSGTELTVAPLLLLEPEPRIPALARRWAADVGRDAEVEQALGAAALAERRYLEAATRFDAAERLGAPMPGMRLYRSLALLMAGRLEDAARLAAEAPARGERPSQECERTWLQLQVARAQLADR